MAAVVEAAADWAAMGWVAAVRVAAAAAALAVGTECEFNHGCIPITQQPTKRRISPPCHSHAPARQMSG
jgi:hypothetical protein